MAVFISFFEDQTPNTLYHYGQNEYRSMRISNDSGSQSRLVRILHLDDDPTDALLIKTLIKEAHGELNASVDWVTTKDAYLAALRKGDLDLILSDYRMPGYDGDAALCDAIELCPNIPFIMITGELGEDRAVETLKAGATDYVLKDRLARLVPSIKRALKDAALQEERRETERRLIEAQRLTHLGNWEWDVRKGAMYWSAEMYSILGTDPDTFSPTLDSVSRFLHPDDRTLADTLQRRLTTTGGSVNIDLRIIRPDGSVRVLHVVGGVTKSDRQGRPLVLAGTCQDITARKQTETALAEANQKLEAHMEMSPLAVIEWGADMRLIRWSREAERIFGWKAEEVLGKRMEDFRWIYSEDLEHVADVSNDLQTGADPQRFSLNRNYRKDGSVVWCEWYNSSLRDDAGRLRSILSLVLDVTERKRSEEVLRETNERLKRVLEVETVGVMFWDLNTGCMTNANDTFLKTMGYSRAEVEARELTWQKLTPPEYVELSQAEIRKFMASGRIGPYEKEYFHKDGSRQWFVFAGSSLGNNACVEFCVDISARKQVEAALAEAHRQIQSIIDNTPAIVYAFDLEERFVMANTALAEVLHTTPVEMIGKRRHEFMPKEDADWHEANDRKVIEAGKALEFEEYSQLNGRSITWLTTKFPLHDTQGRIYAVAGISADISERKQAEEALRASELNLRLMVSQASDGMMVVAPNGVIEAVSALGADILGYGETEMVGRNVAEFAASLSRLDAILTLEELRRSTPKPLTSTARIKTKDGSLVWLSVTASFVSPGTHSERYFVRFQKVDLPLRKNGG